MSSVLMTSAAGFFGRPILRLLGAGSEVRNMKSSPRRTAQEHAAVDAVAGSEFVDDQIRALE